MATALNYLDNYCERAGDASLWAEPLNAVTNLAFILAALLVARALRCHPERSEGSPAMGEGILRVAQNDKKIDLWLLAAALFSIGVGSGLWHLFATKETMLADVIPIAIFINIYLLSALRRLFALRWLLVLLLWGGYQAVSVAAQLTLPADMWHGSVMYLPTFAALAVMTVAFFLRKSAFARVFLLVMLVWTASLIFRTADLEICGSFPVGTHFLWHILNAWVLWRLLMVLVHASSHSIVTESSHSS